MCSNLVQVKQEIMDEIPNDIESPLIDTVFIDCTRFLVKDEEQEIDDRETNQENNLANFQCKNEFEMCRNIKTEDTKPNKNAEKVEGTSTTNCKKQKAKTKLKSRKLKKTICKKESDSIQSDKAKQPKNLKHHCEFCTKIFERQITLHDHFLKHHKDKIKNNLKDFVTSKIYKCKNKPCMYSTTFKMCLKRHISASHNDDKSKSCITNKPKSEKKCDKAKQPKNLKHHCEFCTKIFERQITLHDHFLKHHKDKLKNNLKDFVTSKIYKCKNKPCMYSTTFKMCLKRHISASHNDDKSKNCITNKPKSEKKCQFCDKTFVQKILMDNHMIRQHKDQIKDNPKDFISRKLHTCNDCDYTTVYASYLKLHLIRIHGAPQLETACQFCDKRFARKSSLDGHMLQNHKEHIKNNLKHFITTKIHECSVCSFVTKRKEVLSVHQATVHNESRMNCQFCDKTFLKRVSLDDHILKQHKELDNVKDYVTNTVQQCELCGFMTAYSSDLKRHLSLVHKTSQLEVMCMFCGEMFSRKCLLDNHLLKSHNEQVVDNLKEFITTTIHNCVLCSFITTRKDALKRHLATVHNESEICCNFCGKIFRRKCTLDGHLLKKHKEEIKDNLDSFITSTIHICPECPYVSTNKSHFKEHICKSKSGT